jgi:hypothetical protein
MAVKTPLKWVGTHHARSLYSRFSINELKAPRSIGAKAGAASTAAELILKSPASIVLRGVA